MAAAKPKTGAELKAALIAEAHALGFDAVRITRADLAVETSEGLDGYIAAGNHGDMDWLAREPERRRHPKGLWPEARSVVVLGLNYGPEADPLDGLAHRDRGVIASYALGKDYHDVVKKRLKALGRWLGEASGLPLKVFVDTAPVMEKPLAEAAGLGWQGKHTNLVSRDFGSWLFLGEIFTAAELPPDEAGTDRCGNCTACQDICPTAAFPAPYRLDARRCISYLTIENKGPIPAEFRAAMGNRIYGCDDCLAICPWNKFASRTAELAFLPREGLTGPILADLAMLDDAAFRDLFAGSPIKRIGRDRFVRNVLIAIGNSGSPKLAGVAEPLLQDVSPLVRGMAVWALSRLAPARLAGKGGGETDTHVLAEWALAAPAIDAGRAA
ncbi:MAG TPA: tRNA epoxyqueuosine(34) reductase QueG [Alphaproteobacteria bacterium]|nr:tRNA epoxyqueuosine(34) reductase QueG [Alphaproteobacteria bacterium]